MVGHLWSEKNDLVKAQSMMTMMMGGWVSPWPLLREESSGDEELNAALIPTNYL